MSVPAISTLTEIVEADAQAATSGIKTDTWTKVANDLTIESQGDDDAAVSVLRDVVAMRKEIEESCNPVKKAAKAAHTAACAWERKLLLPVLAAESMLRTKHAEWVLKAQEKERAEQRRQQEEAREQEEERRLAEAVALEEEGRAAEAEAVIEAPPPPPPPAPARLPQSRTTGVSNRATYKCDENVDVLELAKAVAAGTQPPSLLLPNMPSLNALARSHQDNFSVPGCQLLKGVSTAVRS